MTPESPAARLLARLLPRSTKASAKRSTAPGEAWFCVRRYGTVQRSGWTRGTEPAALARSLTPEPGDVVEMCVVDAVDSVPWNGFRKVFTNRARGILGIELVLADKRLRYAPTRTIATNRSFQRTLDRFLDRHDATRRKFAAEGEVRALSARQYLVRAGGEAEPLSRGTTPVAPRPGPGENRARDIADGIGTWMLANQSSDGSLPYKYWPSRGRESPADNAIRRFLASIALARLADFRNSPEMRDAAVANLSSNLDRYYRDIGDGLGAIVEPAGAKLGAAALAALAILESPARARFAHQFDCLSAGIRALAAPNGGFRTFHFPAARDGDNWNFYSGEALLFWAETLRRGESVAPPPERCAAAFRHCRDQHRRARNPAFVPWHTQACASLYAATSRREFANFAFEMNDWLLPMQQWEEIEADLRGRFYDPGHREYGPPHAASTAVYCEGLADAAALAQAVGDGKRAAVYRRAVDHGLRSLRQMQFRDWRDAFYVSRPDRVMGALRTEVYDNAIRVDSAAHALAAALKVLRPTQLPARRA